MVELIMIGLLVWQINMPAVNNAKFSFSIDKDGTIVKMNTQTGEMQRCDKDFVCEQKK